MVRGLGLEPNTPASKAGILPHKLTPNVDGGAGIEPAFRSPELRVLPLDDPPPKMDTTVGLEPTYGDLQSPA